MALSGKLKTLQKLPAKSRGIAWKDKDVEELIELMKEETIMFSLENAKTPKEKRAVYKSVQVQLENKGNVHRSPCAKYCRLKLVFTSRFIASSLK